MSHAKVARRVWGDNKVLRVALICALAAAIVACGTVSRDHHDSGSGPYRKVFSWGGGSLGNCQPRPAEAADITDEGLLAFTVRCFSAEGAFGKGEDNLVVADLEGDRRLRVLLKSQPWDGVDFKTPKIDSVKFLPDGRILLVCSRVGGVNAACSAPELDRPGRQAGFRILDPKTGALTSTQWLDWESVLHVEVFADQGLVLFMGPERIPDGGSWGGTRSVLLYELRSGTDGASLLVRRGSPFPIGMFCAAGDRCLTRDPDGTPILVLQRPDPDRNVLRRYTLAGRDTGRALTMPGSFAVSYAFGYWTPDTFAVAYSEPPPEPMATLQQVDSVSGSTTFSAFGGTTFPEDMLFLDDRLLVLAYGLDDRLEVWDTKSQKRVQSFSHRVQARSGARELFQSRSGAYLGWATSGGTIAVMKRE